MKHLKYIMLGILMLFVFTITVKAEDLTADNFNTEQPDVLYNTHVQSYGWNNFSKNGEMSGTEGQAKRLEAITIKLNSQIDGSISYMAHVQSYGWENNWHRNGEMSGTTGQAKRLEAIKIKLSGNVATKYDVYYRVHVQSYGWMNWVKNGEIAGTEGQAKRLEAIEIKLVKKDEEQSEYIKQDPVLNYTSHVQSYGWMDQSSNGEITGTTGEGKRIEAYKVNVISPDYSGNINYKSYVEGQGWENNWKTQNEISGITGERKRIEAIKLELTGELKDNFDIYYRVHVQGYGWLGWAKNGEIAGTTELDLRIEAMEFKLVKKGTGEETGNSYKIKDARLRYQSHIRKIGNQEEKNEGEIAGTTGQGLRMEGIKIVADTNLSGSVLYQTYIEHDGWENSWKSNGNLSGTEGQSKAIQLIRIKLDGELSEKYDIYYRVHSDKYGWLGWAKNGEIAGVKSYDIQAIQIKLISKVKSDREAYDTNNHYIDKINYIPVYYSQKDSRWANNWYGAGQMKSTGCAPTSMAMAYSAILGKVILPVDVANYLYYNTNQYNHYALGTGGKGIIYASDYYGIKCTPIKNIEEMAQALADGKILFAAMGNGKFATSYWTHAIVLHSYNGGNTIAYDPLTATKNGWISLNQVWNEQSWDPDDYSGGSNFYSLERFY